MKIETTIREAALLRRCTWAQAMVENKRILRAIRHRIQSQAKAGWEKQNVKILELGGFSISVGSDATYPVTLNLEREQLDILRRAFALVRWPENLPEEMEDVLFELEDDLVCWCDRAKAADEIRKLPKDQRKRLLAEAEQEGDNEQEAEALITGPAEAH